MTFHLTVLVDGALTGALYAPIALSFVIVYRASGMINFALGEWTMLAAALVAGGLWTLDLGLTASLVAACLGMAIPLGFGLALEARKRLWKHDRAGVQANSIHSGR